MSPFARPMFDPSGRVVARRALPVGERTYEPGQELTADDRAQLAPSLLATLWQLGQVDTLPAAAEPSDAELERLTAPRAAPQGKQARR